MFRRKSSDADDFKRETQGAVHAFEASRIRGPAAIPPVPVSRGGPVAFHPDVPNRPMTSYIPPPTPEPMMRDNSEKRLTVGRDISLAGEIVDCDRLTIEGMVRATLSDARLLEITKGGQFHGTVNVENAEIAGTFEGEITVRNRLHIHASGRIFGKVRYGHQLEIGRGGRITGDLAHDAALHEADIRPVGIVATDARSG